MGGAEIAKDAIRIATTAGLSKDVIDLLERKISLLVEQNTTLQTENTNLKQETADLRKEVERLQPVGTGLDETAKKFIKALFENGGPLDFDRTAAMLGVSKGKAAYYIDVLRKHRMIVGTGMVIGDALGAYDLTPDGREFAVTSGLIK